MSITVAMRNNFARRKAGTKLQNYCQLPQSRNGMESPTGVLQRYTKSSCWLRLSTTTKTSVQLAPIFALSNPVKDRSWNGRWIKCISNKRTCRYRRTPPCLPLKVYEPGRVLHSTIIWNFSWLARRRLHEHSTQLLRFTTTYNMCFIGQGGRYSFHRFFFSFLPVNQLSHFSPQWHKNSINAIANELIFLNIKIDPWSLSYTCNNMDTHGLNLLDWLYYLF